VLDENLETLHPTKQVKRAHSRNGDLLGEQVPQILIFIFSQIEPQHLQGAHRKLSRHIAEGDEDIAKMKQYMEQKGL
jgi:hypothetical protein